MTKSQNTKNERNADVSKTLTEQWKKGELKDGKYWVKLSFGGTILTAEYLEYNGVFELDDHYYEDEEISEVLAPVPSYEEWKRFIDANDRLFEAVKSLTIERDMTQEENAQLKELLKKAETQIIAYKNNDTLPERAFYEKEVEELLTLIDEELDK